MDRAGVPQLPRSPSPFYFGDKYAVNLQDLFRAQASPAPARVRNAAPALSVADVSGLFTGAISRDLAMQVPTVRNCVHLITGTASQITPTRYRGAEALPLGQLLTQPDPMEPWATTIARTVESLLLHGTAAWLVIARDTTTTEQHPDGYPVRARLVPGDQVSPIRSSNLADYNPVTGYYIHGTRVEPERVIYFDAGRDGVLATGARAIAQAFDLEAAARRLSETELPAGVLVNTGHELGPDEAQAVLDGFQAARRKNAMAFLQNVEYHRTDLNAADLALIDSRATSATDIARLFSVPVAMVGASPTGNASALLYSNLAANSAAFVQQAVAPYLVTIESTLSLPTVTPRGQAVRFDVGSFLRSEPSAATDYVVALTGAGVITPDEARSFLGIAPQGTTTPTLTPGRI